MYQHRLKRNCTTFEETYLSSFDKFKLCMYCVKQEWTCRCLIELSIVLLWISDVVRILCALLFFVLCYSVCSVILCALLFCVLCYSVCSVILCALLFCVLCYYVCSVIMCALLFCVLCYVYFNIIYTSLLSLGNAIEVLFRQTLNGKIEKPKNCIKTRCKWDQTYKQLFSESQSFPMTCRISSWPLG